MTPAAEPSGTNEHPEVEELSDLGEGLLPTSRIDEVRRHLEGCATCRDIQESLAGIRGLLGSLPDPAPMPAEVAGRIDAALAAEARYAADVSRETPATDGAAPDAPASAVAVSRETSPRAAAKRASHRRPRGRPRAATGPARGPRRWPRILLGTAAAAALVTFGILMLQLPENGDAGTGDAALSKSEGSRKAAPENALTAGTLETRVQDMLAGADSQDRSPTEAERAPEDSEEPLIGGEDGGGTALPPCVRDAVKRSEAPLAAEADTFEGSPAYIVVLPHPGDTGQVDAYVVDSSCTAAPSKTGDILLRRTYSRP